MMTGTLSKKIAHLISEGFKILGFSDHTPQPYPADSQKNCQPDWRAY